jgi:thioredoxin reductase
LDIAIIGAGPYALSLAAQAAGQGLSFRIFGHSLDTWRRRMPRGMHLKSDGFASNLTAPEPGHALADYCRARGLPYHDTNIPVPLQTFIDYAEDFQRKLVPNLEPKLVTGLAGEDGHFRLTLDDGEVFTARQVVVSVGITHFDYKPEELADLPAELCSHSAEHEDPAAMAGREVVVLGAGSSAVDLAVLLHEAGAKVRLAARRPSLHFFAEPSGKAPSLLYRLRRPPSGIGPGWPSRMYTDVPNLFRRLPLDMRLRIVRNHLGPASAFHMKARIEGRIPLLLNHRLKGAERGGAGVRLQFETPEGPATVETGHVVCATGYRPDLRRLPFLDEDLRRKVGAISHTPVLSSDFESSVPGLYFLGPVAANSFGPVMRFMFGNEWATPRLARRLARAAR